MLVTHLGHACVLVEVAGRRILLDPGNIYDTWHGVSDIDAVLITHQHADHLDAENLRELVAGDRRIAVYGEASALEMNPIDGAIVPSTSWALGDVTITPVPGEHACIHADIPTVGNMGFVIEADGEPTFFHPGDSLSKVPSGVDVLALPVHGPWAAMGEHVDFVRAVGARHAFGIHEALLSERGWNLAIHRYEDMSQSKTTVHDFRGATPWEVPA